MPKRTLYEVADLRIVEEDGFFYACYDAGSHQPTLRKDRISREEAEKASTGKDNAVKMLFNLQKRLIDSGIDPYSSNIGD